jgi:hypothetical protein
MFHLANDSGRRIVRVLDFRHERDARASVGKTTAYTHDKLPVGLYVLKRLMIYEIIAFEKKIKAGTEGKKSF